MPADPDAPTLPPRCPQCRRPRVWCFCADLGHVENTTPVHVLQHPKEAKHPFNTVRLLNQILDRVDVVTSEGPCEAAEDFRRRLPADTAILYPGPDVPVLEDMAPTEHPSAIVLLDGTWSTAKKLLRFHPWLTELPRVQLRAATPGAYRIRKEPTPQHLSTLEAVADALAVLEPETAGIPHLRDGLRTMVDGHLTARAAHDPGPRFRNRGITREATERHALHRTPESYVMAEIECARHIGPAFRPGGHARLFRVVLQNLGGGPAHDIIIAPEHPLSERILGYFELTAHAVPAPTPPGDAAQRILAMLHGRKLLTWSPTVARHIVDFLRAVEGDVTVGVTSLKALYGNRRGASMGPVESVGLPDTAPPVAPEARGRAGRRLAHGMALAKALGADA